LKEGDEGNVLKARNPQAASLRVRFNKARQAYFAHANLIYIANLFS